MGAGKDFEKHPEDPEIDVDVSPNQQNGLLKVFLLSTVSMGLEWIYHLRITLLNVKNGDDDKCFVWREVKVLGTLGLYSLANQVLLPLFGYYTGLEDDIELPLYEWRFKLLKKGRWHRYRLGHGGKINLRDRSPPACVAYALRDELGELDFLLSSDSVWDQELSRCYINPSTCTNFKITVERIDKYGYQSSGLIAPTLIRGSGNSIPIGVQAKHLQPLYESSIKDPNNEMLHDAITNAPNLKDKYRDCPYNFCAFDKTEARSSLANALCSMQLSEGLAWTRVPVWWLSHGERGILKGFEYANNPETRVNYELEVDEPWPELVPWEGQMMQRGKCSTCGKNLKHYLEPLKCDHCKVEQYCDQNCLAQHWEPEGSGKGFLHEELCKSSFLDDQLGLKRCACCGTRMLDRRSNEWWKCYKCGIDSDFYCSEECQVSNPSCREKNHWYQLYRDSVSPRKIPRILISRPGPPGLQ